MVKSFGELLGSMRAEKGLSAYALAQRTGLSDQAIHDLERQKSQPSLETARRLAAALGVTLAWVEEKLPPVELPEPIPGRPRGRPRKEAEPAAQSLPGGTMDATRKGRENGRKTPKKGDR